MFLIGAILTATYLQFAAWWTGTLIFRGRFRRLWRDEWQIRQAERPPLRLLRRFFVFGRDIRMALFVMIAGFLQMLDSFGCMWICLCLLAGFGVSQRSFGVRGECRLY